MTLRRQLVSVPTVLVVDDDEGARRYTARVLEDAGYQVLLAGDGLEGLALVERQSPRVHLVVTDVLMPHMTGPELAACLASRVSHPPVLYVSGNHGSLDITGPLLRKPFLPHELTQMVHLFLLQTPVAAGVLEEG